MIRLPLRREMALAFDQAMNCTGPISRAFYSGLGTGYAIAFDLIDRDALVNARSMPFARNAHIDFFPHPAMQDEDTAHACGVRHGYYLGTSERDDADECALCGERICLDLDDHTSCVDGSFCALGCSEEWHRSGPSFCGLEGDDE